MVPYRIDFGGLAWESPMDGVRHKVIAIGEQRMRFVEYSADMAPHWCEVGHTGRIISGRMAIEFDDQTLEFGPGDGVVIPTGRKHRHRARVLTERVEAFFIE